MRLSDLDSLEKLIHKLENKADYVDMRVNESFNTIMVMKDGKMQEIRSGNDYGASIRVLKDGAWGFAFTTRPSQLSDIADSALKLAQVLDSDAEMAESTIETGYIKSKAKIKPSDVSLEDKKKVMIEVEQGTSLKEIVSTTINYIDQEGRILYLNSEGSNLEMNQSRVALFVNAVAAAEGVIQFGHKSTGGAAGFEVIEKEDLEKFGRTAASKAVRLLRADSPPSGRFPVIMDPELTGVFIHEALGHATEADLILQNDSILHDKMGSQIGSELVTIIDDASMDAFGYYAYDAEGVATKENVLVEKGTLISFLNSRETGAKLGMPSSGNARSAVGEQPIVRMSNTYLQPGDLTLEELMEDLSNGIYLKGSRGGQVDTGKGIFQFNAAESFMIDNGEIGEPLRDVSLSGNILEMLKKVNGVGSDFHMGVGFCRKSGQTVPVGDGGPHVMVSEAMVGGSQ